MSPSPRTKPISWGILATGKIAKTFARAILESTSGRLLAVASRTAAPAEAFAREFGAVRSFSTYEALLADPEVEAVYIATPHPLHAPLTLAAARAKKHVLCEKPLGINHAEVMAMFDAAREHGVLLMEAFMYRCHPQTARLVELLGSGALGQVQAIEATFSFRAPFDPESRLFAPTLGGGGILDVGGYPVSMARLLAGAARGADFAEPVTVVGSGVLGPTGVDEWASAILRFPGDILATVNAGVRAARPSVVRVFATEGSLVVPNPWMPGKDGSPSEIRVSRGGGEEVEIIESPRGLYALEADEFARAIALGRAAHPAPGAEDSLGNARALDQWRLAVGLVYPTELSCV